MAGLSKEEWNTLYQDYTKEIMKGINKQKQALKHDVGDTLYKQAVYNTLNGLYIQKATVDDLNDLVRYRMTNNADNDDKHPIKAEVNMPDHEITIPPETDWREFQKKLTLTIEDMHRLLRNIEKNKGRIWE